MVVEKSSDSVTSISLTCTRFQSLNPLPVFLHPKSVSEVLISMSVLGFVLSAITLSGKVVQSKIVSGSICNRSSLLSGLRSSLFRTLPFSAEEVRQDMVAVFLPVVGQFKESSHFLSDRTYEVLPLYCH